MGAGHVVPGAVWMTAAVLIAALGGFAFWTAAAHLVSPHEVGQATALFTLSQVLTYATSLGLPIAAGRYAIDRSAGATTLLSWALVLTAASSAVGVAVFLPLIPSRVAAPLWHWGTPTGVVAFLLVVTGMSFTALVDVRLMALRRWRWVLYRAAFVGIVRLPFLAVHPVADNALWLFILVGGSQALSGIVGAFVVCRLGGREFGLSPLPPETRAALRFASVNWLSQLALQAPFFALPVIVLLNVDPARNASFYVAWSIMSVVFIGCLSISQVVLVEGGRDGTSLHHQLRAGLWLTAGPTAAIALVSSVAAGAVVTVFGHPYQESARILPALLAANVGWAVTAICLAAARVREDTRSTVTITVVFAAAILGPAAVLTGRQGLTGAVHAWLFGNVIAAICATWLTWRRPGVTA